MKAAGKTKDVLNSGVGKAKKKLGKELGEALRETLSLGDIDIIGD